MSVTAEQLRMARAALKITVRDLAERAGLDKGTIIRVESGAGAHALTLKQLRQVLEAAGVEFIDEVAGLSGPGIRLKWETVTEQRRQGKEDGSEEEGRRKFDAACDRGLASYWFERPEQWTMLSESGRQVLSIIMFGDAFAADEAFGHVVR